MTATTSQPISTAPVIDISPPADRDPAFEIMFFSPAPRVGFDGSNKLSMITGREETATLFEQDRQRLQKIYDIVLGPRPAGYFGHDGQDACFFAVRFFWAGGHMIHGGLRLLVEWTSLGRRAVCCGLYRKFSTEFVVDQMGFPVGITHRLGGLVEETANPDVTPLPMMELREATLRDSKKFVELLEAEEAAGHPLSRALVSDLTARYPRLGAAYSFYREWGFPW